jgi:hypothetical protein
MHGEDRLYKGILKKEVSKPHSFVTSSIMKSNKICSFLSSEIYLILSNIDRFLEYGSARIELQLKL